MNSNDIALAIMENNLNSTQVNQIINALVCKNYITKATFPAPYPNITFADFVKDFWNYETSSYIQEKLSVGQNIHKRYTTIMRQRVIKYWIPYLGDIPIEDITANDIRSVFHKLLETHLASETINQITRSATCPLKWAYRISLIPTDITTQILYCHVKPKARVIPTMEQAEIIIKSEWNNKIAQLANKTALYTGMRIGEIQALQIRDIGKDCIYVRHNWARSDGLKEPKNGSERIVPAPAFLCKNLKQQGKTNPWGTGDDSYIFYGYDRDHPANCRQWNEALHKQISLLGLPKLEGMTFHCWRHFYATHMADKIDYRKLKMITGHKSLDILKHYSNHETDEIIQEARIIMEQMFSSLH